MDMHTHPYTHAHRYKKGFFFLPLAPPGKPRVLVIQLCPPPCDAMDYSLLGSSVHGIHEGRILE